MRYDIEIVGLISIEAESKQEAFDKVRDMFYDEELTIDDLHLDCDTDETDED